MGWMTAAGTTMTCPPEIREKSIFGGKMLNKRPPDNEGKNAYTRRRGIFLRRAGGMIMKG